MTSIQNNDGFLCVRLHIGNKNFDARTHYPLDPLCVSGKKIKLEQSVLTAVQNILKPMLTNGELLAALSTSNGVGHLKLGIISSKIWKMPKNSPWEKRIKWQSVGLTKVVA